jgi:hypothetical protein
MLYVENFPAALLLRLIFHEAGLDCDFALWGEAISQAIERQETPKQ